MYSCVHTVGTIVYFLNKYIFKNIKIYYWSLFFIINYYLTLDVQVNRFKLLLLSLINGVLFFLHSSILIPYWLLKIKIMFQLKYNIMYLIKYICGDPKILKSVYPWWKIVRGRKVLFDLSEKRLQLLKLYWVLFMYGITIHACQVIRYFVVFVFIFL